MASKSIQGPVKLERLKDTDSVGPPANSVISNPQPTRGPKSTMNPNEAKYNPQPLHGNGSFAPNSAMYRPQAPRGKVSLNPNAVKNRPQPPRGKFSLNPNATDMKRQQQTSRLGAKSTVNSNAVKNRQTDTMIMIGGRETSSQKKFTKRAPRSRKA